MGDNHIDLIVAGEYAAPEDVAALLHLDLAQPIVVVLQHSETTAPYDSYDQMKATLLAVAASGIQAVMVTCALMLVMAASFKRSRSSL
ncbi:MAG: hypothetical protein IPL58_03690 [Betaproteobacteria bacterium]|uniref:Uncharacterized protein n=1 Tax=Candidatus Proximibacter danicus TaxID=2954365 RepID=A0A9D7JZ17_9PROT|nr:hypothetical protein [Candidatus Proximibacter danicus]